MAKLMRFICRGEVQTIAIYPTLTVSELDKVIRAVFSVPANVQFALAAPQDGSIMSLGQLLDYDESIHGAFPYDTLELGMHHWAHFPPIHQRAWECSSHNPSLTSSSSSFVS